MRIALILGLMSQLLFISVQASQKKTNIDLNSARIEDYLINPQKDFSWMTENEKASYIAFLYNLNLIVDAELNKNSLLVVANDQKSSSHLDIQKEIFKKIFSVNEAQALFPLVPVAGAVVATGVRAVAPQVISYVARREIFMGMAEVVKPTVSLWSRLTSAKGIAAVSTAASVPFVASGLVTDDKDSAKPQSPEQRQPVAGAAAAGPAIAAKPQSAEATLAAPIAVADARVDGSFCIFGGYASKYKNVEGRSFCPAPAETVNSTICANKNINPSFLCQSFGLSTSPHQAVASDTLCIPLRSENGLKDLTVRCTKAFVSFAETARSFDPQKIDEIQKQIITGVQALEKERGASDVGILSYCADQNKMNRGTQKSECSAITTLMNHFKKSLPTVASAAQQGSKSTTGSGTAPQKVKATK